MRPIWFTICFVAIYIGDITGLDNVTVANMSYSWLRKASGVAKLASYRRLM